MHIHILGIAGSFMSGLARIAQECGHRVTGADAALHPPASAQLEAAGIVATEGYGAEQLRPPPDCVVVGNALSRGVEAVERMLDDRLPYTSGPQWLRAHVLRERTVLAVAGTHGKTTTSAMLEHILRAHGAQPGCLLGGVPEDGGCAARLGEAPWFVLEADEYDTAFFDKRSKFVHYAPDILVLNNLEFDHADIFADLAAIERQFHHLVRTVPGGGRILVRAGDAALERVLARGCWTKVETFGADAGCDWRLDWAPGAALAVEHRGRRYAADYAPLGAHNAHNAAAAVAAAHHAGVDPAAALDALASFRGVHRRLSRLHADAHGGALYDDFAHHPTEIRASIEAVRARHARVLAVVDPASNSMRMGVHRRALAAALAGADLAWVLDCADAPWADAAWADAGAVRLAQDAALPAQLLAQRRPGDAMLVMSNRPGSRLGARIRALWAADEVSGP